MEIYFSGNAANAAEDLRERYNVELFILAVNASADAMRTLNRLAGEHLAHQKVIPLIGADKLHGSELAYVGRTLCGLVEPAAATIQPHFTEEYATHKTTKRDVSKFIEAKRTLVIISFFFSYLYSCFFNIITSSC